MLYKSLLYIFGYIHLHAKKILANNASNRLYVNVGSDKAKANLINIVDRQNYTYEIVFKLPVP